ncbi:alpha/beta hydrolase [Sphingobium algorifonticola]|nr:alpha/beta hydrolase [Sphingobium algorifonticola]
MRALNTSASLDPYIAAMLSEGEPPLLDRATVPEAREEARRRFRPIDRTVPVLDYVADRTVTIERTDIAVRIYVPMATRPMPMLLFIHGGGFVLGDLDTHDGICRHLAAGAGAIVVAVHYRRAPEHPFPAAVGDCAAVGAWIEAQSEFLGGDAQRIAIVGDSAGGTLAIAVVLQAVGVPIKALALVYPVTDYPDDRRESYRAFATGFGLTRQMMMTFWQLYAPDRQNEAAPLRHGDLKRLPPTLVVTASHDILRDEGEAFAIKTMAAGVETQHKRVDGVTHGFLHLVGAVPAADTAMKMITEWLRDTLSSHSGNCENA